MDFSGENNFGVVFKIKKDGTGYEKLLDFNGINGANPWGSLISDGVYLYGMTASGGAYQNGVIFKLKIKNVIPLKLLSFTGQVQHGSTALLQWQTVNEVNTQQFMVERSNGAVFSTIGSVQAYNKQGDNNYTFIDAHPLAGLNYYRLKMQDKDGGFAYTNTVQLNFGNTLFNVVLQPNPVSNTAVLNITSPVASTYSITITTTDGSIVKTVAGNASVGTNTLAIEVSNLAAGAYILHYKGTGGEKTITMIKK